MCAAPVAARPNRLEIGFFIQSKVLRLVFDTAALRGCGDECSNNLEVHRLAQAYGLLIFDRPLLVVQSRGVVAAGFWRIKLEAVQAHGFRLTPRAWACSKASSSNRRNASRENRLA